MNVNFYECSIAGFDGGSIIGAETANKAKYRFLFNLDLDGVEYKHIRARKIQNAYSSRVEHTAKYRGVPLANLGTRVEVGGNGGTIVGSNASANFDVLFDSGETLNCHPNWKIRYFNPDGSVMYDFANSH